MKTRLNLTVRYALIINGTMLAVIVLLGVLFMHKLAQNSETIREFSTEELRASLIGEIEKNGHSIADVLAERMVNPLYTLDMRRMRELLLEAEGRPGVEYALVTGQDELIVHDGSMHIGTYGQPLSWSASGGEVDEAIRRISAPIDMAGENLGSVHIGLSLQSAFAQSRAMEERLSTQLDGSARSVMLQIALWSSLLFLAGLAAATIISRRFAAPIRELAEYAREVGKGLRTPPPSMRRRDEIGLLANSLDAMSQDLRISAGEADYLAYHDSLTRLPNRAQLRRTLRDAIESSRTTGERLALLFVDLDQFKQVNDTLGHEAGDEILTAVAGRLADRLSSWNAVNKSSASLARLGGDEFTVLQRHVDDIASTENLASEILATLSEPIESAEHAFAVGASIGITNCPADGNEFNVLLRNADRAMYRAKQQGRNTFCHYHRSMDGTATRELSLEADLRDALDNNGLTLAYQPIVNALTGEAIAVEALCRWHHPVLGFVQPSRFVQLAENSGQIEHLDQFVISQLTRDVCVLRENGFGGLAAAANIASLHLPRPLIVEHIKERLAFHEIDGSKLRIELREKSIMRHLERTSKAASRLRDLGVEIWIDDFGTRISTIKHIDALPIAGIKIHSDFIDGISAGKNERVVAQAITEMCHNIGLPVTAEGVEHQAQLEYLQEIACDFAQGYLFARPVPLDELIAYLRRHRKRDDGRLILLSDHRDQA